MEKLWICCSRKALEHADYVPTFKNPKRILQEKYAKECVVYYEGGQSQSSENLF